MQQCNVNTHTSALKLASPLGNVGKPGAAAGQWARGCRLSLMLARQGSDASAAGLRVGVRPACQFTTDSLI